MSLYFFKNIFSRTILHHKINVKVYSKTPDSKLFDACNSVVWSPEAMPKTLLVEINKRNVCASLQKSLQTGTLLFHEWNTGKEVKLAVALEVSVYSYTNLNGPNVDSFPSHFFGSVLFWLLIMKVRNTQ